uniref:Uncharacterized protein n=1 Tax=Varanus komodoensis TaxID=61221 RepID=A0A8D2L549_VARKO
MPGIELGTFYKQSRLSATEAARECAVQLRKIGDKKNLQQRILNLISKLFCPGT